MSVIHEYERISFACPICDEPWEMMNVDKSNPNCKKEIKCVECKSIWRLVE